jgi:hypothetical protein
MQESKYFYKTEEYAEQKQILFEYVLSCDEKKIFSDTVYDVINKFKSSTHSKKYVEDKYLSYQKLFVELERFFKENPWEYFIRLSALSQNI